MSDTSGAIAVALVSCRHITSGAERSRNRSSERRRARTEFTFHVATRKRSGAGHVADMCSRAASAAIRRSSRACCLATEGAMDRPRAPVSRSMPRRYPLIASGNPTRSPTSCGGDSRLFIERKNRKARSEHRFRHLPNLQLPHLHLPHLHPGDVELPDGGRVEHARSGAVNGAHVVCVHGWPDSWKSFQPVMDSLPDEFSATSVSLAGFGGSDAIASPARPSDLARSVIALYD